VFCRWELGVVSRPLWDLWSWVLPSSGVLNRIFERGRTVNGFVSCFAIVYPEKSEVVLFFSFAKQHVDRGSNHEYIGG
jgi:hypothetical protein